jgi:TolA-binding protein
MYMKGMSLVKLGRRAEGARQFQELVEAYPSSEQATKAKAQLKSLNFGATKARARKKAN